MLSIVVVLSLWLSSWSFVVVVVVVDFLLGLWIDFYTVVCLMWGEPLNTKSNCGAARKSPGAVTTSFDRHSQINFQFSGMTLEREPTNQN